MLTHLCEKGLMWNAINMFKAGLRIVNESQKTYPKYRFIFVQFLMSKSSISWALKDLKQHESHYVCLVSQPRGGALDYTSEIKVNDYDKGRGVLLWMKEADVAP